MDAADEPRASDARQWRAATAIGCATGAAILGWSSVAWACSPYATLASKMSLGAGLPDSKVIVAGDNFVSTVDVLWARDTSTLATATTLATVSGPRFQVQITIPQVEPGMYYVVAVGRDGGGVKGQAASTFEVTSDRVAGNPVAGDPVVADPVVADPATPPDHTSIPDRPTEKPPAGATAKNPVSPVAQPVPAVAAPVRAPLAAGLPATRPAPDVSGPRPGPSPVVASGPSVSLSRPSPVVGAVQPGAEVLAPGVDVTPLNADPWAFAPSKPGATSGLFTSPGTSASRNGTNHAIALGMLLAGGVAAAGAAGALVAGRRRKLHAIRSRR